MTRHARSLGTVGAVAVFTGMVGNMVHPAAVAAGDSIILLRCGKRSASHLAAMPIRREPVRRSRLTSMTWPPLCWSAPGNFARMRLLRGWIACRGAHDEPARVSGERDFPQLRDRRSGGSGGGERRRGG